jgi:hypothetical protein
MSTEKLVYALRQVLRAEQEEQDARERYGGCNWGYHGFQWAEGSRKAGEEFAAALTEAIDARVRAALAEVELQQPSSGNA